MTFEMRGAGMLHVFVIADDMDDSIGTQGLRTLLQRQHVRPESQVARHFCGFAHAIDFLARTAINAAITVPAIISFIPAYSSV
ncbi:MULTISPECIES: hypothetical protein [unclassified Janthinobacterium]|uniref:hypothetical protein n=1 Tax=unclassified Janthinobacterium TaxID=2610881 RepID=UPI00160A86BB|nr:MULTISPECIES: hypothetical protein [unclassified Janthinobacterium]MBB5607745.1 hypothetical protein [Janthinobacterium sp. S3T4]MBB5613106.1 hypothetical protein [Janthinobacterium sp. S3M3]